MENRKTIEIYIPLLEEGTPTIRGTQAVLLENGLFEVLPTTFYDPEDEVWEFLPGSFVRVKETKDYKGERILLAYEEVR